MPWWFISSSFIDICLSCCHRTIPFFMWLYHIDTVLLLGYFLNFTNMDNLDCLIQFNAGVIYLSLDLGTLQLTRGNQVFTQIDLQISHIFTPVEQASYICTAKIKINFLLSFILKIYYQKRRIFLSKKKITHHISFFKGQKKKF